MEDFCAVILAGGSGERFWPLSTPARPKQFLDIFGTGSLLRQSAARLEGLADPRDVYVVTSAALAAATRAELPSIPSGNVIGEPMRRDTGAAVAAGVGIAAKSGDPVVGFFPSDQLVADAGAFKAAVSGAIGIARVSDCVVVLGIRPDHPSTAFGYVNPSTGRFVEKPDADKAKAYLDAGYLWNAGMFIAKASVFRDAFRRFAPELSVLADPAFDPQAMPSLYPGLPRISFDFAVMERLPEGSVKVVPGDFGWDDVGSYAAFDKYFPHDGGGNVLDGSVKSVDCGSCIAISRGAPVSMLGVSNLVVVSTPDGVLVADKSRLSDMKRLFAK